VAAELAALYEYRSAVIGKNRPGGTVDAIHHRNLPRTRKMP